MSGVYKKITLVGTSQESYEDAIERAIHRAEETLKNLQWFEVEEFRGGIDDEGNIEYQAILNAAFRLRK